MNAEQLIEALTQLARQAEVNQANVNLLVKAMKEEQEERANRPGPLPSLTAKTFAELDLEKGTEESQISQLCAWEACIQNNITSINGHRADLPLPRLVSGILGSLKGRCRTMAQGMDPQKYDPDSAPNQNLDRAAILQRFFSDLSNILLGASVPEKAYALFRRRKQKPGEDIHPYHAELGVLYKKAFPIAWNQPENQRTLIRHFLENLHDRDLAYDVNITQATPTTYNAALQLLEQRAGTWDRFRMSYGGKGGQPGPARNDGPPQGAQGGVEPMDIGALRRGRGRMRNQNTPVGANGKNAGKKNNNPPQRNQGRGGLAGAASPAPRPGQGKPKRRCFNCGDEAHLVRDCPKHVAALTRVDEEQKPEQYFRYPARSPEESEAEDDWDPEATVVAALTRPYHSLENNRRPRSRTTRRPSPDRRIKRSRIEAPPPTRHASPDGRKTRAAPPSKRTSESQVKRSGNAKGRSQAC